MKSSRGLTLVELLVAISVGAVVLLVLFRAYTLALTTHRDMQRQIAGFQQARTVVLWVVGTIQAASEVRQGTLSSVELAGMFDPQRGHECRGFLLSHVRAARTTLMYERRKPLCPEGATSAGGELIVVSAPTVSIPMLSFRYLDAEATAVPDLRKARVIEVTVAVDTDRDGLPDYRLVQAAALRAW